MKFLVDQAVSWHVAAELRERGHDAFHVREIGLANADDSIILDRAGNDDRVLITQDTDFGTLLIRGGLRHPSLILLRTQDGRPQMHLRLIVEAMPLITVALEKGAIAVLTEYNIRVRELR